MNVLDRFSRKFRRAGPNAGSAAQPCVARPDWLLRARVAFLATLPWILGCGPKEFVPAGNAEEAKNLVTTTLEAWKSGKKSSVLQAAAPPILAADQDWQAGAALEAFEIPEAPRLEGGHWRVNVMLTLTTQKTASERKAAGYAVTFEPSIGIVRLDDIPEP